MDYSDLARILPQHIAALVSPLHETALGFGCSFRIDGEDNDITLAYSVRNFKINIKNGMVSISGEYDPRAFYDLYRRTCSDKVKQLLFESAEPCSLCINDKCTTFLMAKNRTIEYAGRKKKLCGPYRHHLSIDVDTDSMQACRDIARMMFEYTYPHMHCDVFYKNEVTYSVQNKESFYLAGYMARHNSLSKSDEELVRSVLSDDKRLAELNSVCDGLPEYIGAIDKFIDGNTYEFLFGIKTARKPETLPEGMICRKINAGEWAVYNSSAGDYKSIWKHFTADFYKAEHKGYDRSRIPFEYYSKDGNFYDVCIPVDADCPADNGKSVRMIEIPVMRAAGFSWYNEADHPQGGDYNFDIVQRIKEAFPHADRLYGICTHSFFGKPMRHGCFYMYDDLEDVPEHISKCDFPGGRWLIESYHHFNGGVCDYPFGRPMNFKTKVDDMHHPGPWIDINYLGARGGYIELGNPAMIKGRRIYETVGLTPRRIAGKLEAPPDSIVTDDEKNAFYTLPDNAEKGSYYIGYTITVPDGKGMYFNRPLIKGIATAEGAAVPEGLSEFILEGGRYLRVTEDILNGEPGWEIEYFEDTAKEAGCTADEKRQFIIKQNNYGKSYEFFIPIL